MRHRPPDQRTKDVGPPIEGFLPPWARVTPQAVTPQTGQRVGIVGHQRIMPIPAGVIALFFPDIPYIGLQPDCTKPASGVPSGFRVRGAGVGSMLRVTPPTGTRPVCRVEIANIAGRLMRF